MYNLMPLLLLVSVFSAQLSNLINSILTGHFNHIDLAAVSYGFLMVMSIGSISQGTISALLPSMQKAIDASNGQEMIASILVFIVYLLFSTIVYFLFYWIVFYLNVSDVYKNTIRAYLLPMFIFLLALQVLSYFVNILIIMNKIKVIAVFGFCATLIDIITSSLLVHGIFDMPKMGAQGAALGSMLGSVTVVFLVLVYVARHFDIKIILKEVNRTILLSRVIELIFITFPAGLVSFLNWAIMFFVTLTLTISVQPESNTSANQILIILCSLVLVFSKVSGNIIVKRMNEIKKDFVPLFFIQVTVGYQIFYMVLMGVILFWFESIVSIFGVDQKIVLIIIPIKWCIFFYVLLNSLDGILTHYLIGRERNLINFKIQVITVILLTALLYTLVGIQEDVSLLMIWLMLVAERSVVASCKIYKIVFQLV